MKKDNRLVLLFWISVLLIFAVGCSRASSPTVTPSPTAIQTPISTPTPLPSINWDALFTPSACRAEGGAQLLDEALAKVDLDVTTFKFTPADFGEAAYYIEGYLSDDFVLPWLSSVRTEPAKAWCFEAKAAGALDYYLNQPHPVADTIRHADFLLGNPRYKSGPIDPSSLPGDFDKALDALYTVAGGYDQIDGQLPPEFKEAITPLLWAMINGIKARGAMDTEGNLTHGGEWWSRYGGNLILPTTTGQAPNTMDLLDRRYLLGEGRRTLNQAAAQIAFAIEHIDWSPFAGMRDVHFEVRTKAGWIKVRDSSDDFYKDDGEPVLLLIDLGGNDVYRNGVASNRTGNNAVSLGIDLAGNDVYEYEVYKTPYDREGLPDADKYGRYKGDDNYGNFSLSDDSRQGGARNGIAMLFDLGQGDDYYKSLRGSQGYAHLGVGVLFDGGGSDTYISEIASQGSAQFGIGVLIDAGSGNDIYKSFSHSQGFGYSAGIGILLDGGGNDTYIADNGDPAQGGIPLYYSPQLPGRANSSLSQGAGSGRRGNDRYRQSFFSGGLGVLRDISGDDAYEASTFAQGAGFWQAAGVLSDGGGNDTYQAYYYAQGSGAHFSVGMLADGGRGNDIFNNIRPAHALSLGAGHDFSLGVFVDEGGDDEYHIANLSAGASNCNGIGFFVDNGGNDTYIATSDNGSGFGNVSSECLKTRPNAKSIGVMIDAGGTDTYMYPPSKYPIPADNKTWGHTYANLPSEYGVGLDGKGETGVHAEK